MSKTPQNNSSETRRRLLKSVLGASTVVTLGYGGNAAAASISCVAKVRDLASGGPPAGTAQFTMIEPKPTQAKTNWGWLRVDVRRYDLLKKGPAFDAFEAGGKIYKTSAPDVEVVGASLAKNQNGYPKDAWVLAYFDDSGALVSTYPSEQLAEPGATPAAQSCLASVNPGAVGNFTFGG
ncbi:hypothetical protein [Thauera humireducens]|uniref:hypothetical protein n=1 Tax=Thauera humireducens TaxID=1134435 RepID=UPI000A7EB842|nr:hypothetical protein [Thauera humireducens]